jgi:hypothetical protein
MAAVVTASVSGKNEPPMSRWPQAFAQANGTVGVSVRGRSCPRLSGGTCPTCAPSAILHQQTARPVVRRAAGHVVLLLGLQRPHVGGLGALGPLRDVELDGLPLSK